MIKNRSPTISIAQIRYFDTSEKHNVHKIKKYIKLAKSRNADIICFPETCIHKTDNLVLRHKLIKEIEKSCKDNSIWCIVTDNFILKGKPYKIAILINRQGKIVGKYKKINLYDDGTNAGKKIFVYKTDFAKIGIVICWDLAFPEIFHKMKKAGAEIIFCPSKWCYEYKAHEESHKIRELSLIKSMLISRAFENLFFVALANPVLNQKDLISYSAIASTHKILKEIKDKEGLIYATLNLKEIKKFSKLYPNKPVF
ncbi:carbon-nitrogen hydrolase family protein [Candidatus Woesearchaeota archaeon]|nr:carbon-nitrogen hydrolase family protein [Candidatus Woesearchaeota archaeon]